MITVEESGETLIEVLMAVVIMGIAFVIIVGGIGVAIIGSAIQNEQATGGSALRSAVEALTSPATKYVPCAPTYPPTAYQAPAGSGITISIDSITYMDPVTNTFKDTCTTDSGIQKITLTATSAGTTHGTGTQQLDVVKRG